MILFPFTIKYPMIVSTLLKSHHSFPKKKNGAKIFVADPPGLGIVCKLHHQFSHLHFTMILLQTQSKHNLTYQLLIKSFTAKNLNLSSSPSPQFSIHSNKYFTCFITISLQIKTNTINLSSLSINKNELKNKFGIGSNNRSTQTSTKRRSPNLKP